MQDGGDIQKLKKLARKISPLRALVAVVAGLFALQSYQQANWPAFLVSGAVLLFVLFSGED